MKNIFRLIILAALLSAMPGYAQDVLPPHRNPALKDYYDIDTITIQNTRYERVLTKGRDKTSYISYFLNDISNSLSNGIYRKKNGDPAERSPDKYGSGKVEIEALRKALSDVFSAEENKQLGEAKDHIWLYLVFSTGDGRVLEVNFIMSASNALLAMPVEKFAQLEQKIKETVTTDISGDHELKELQFVRTMIALNFPFKRSYIGTDAKRNDDDLSRIPKGALLQ